MSLADQMEAFLTDAVNAKPRKKSKPKAPINPNLAVKYTQSGKRLPGERHGFGVPIPKPTIYHDNKTIVDGKFVPIKPITYLEETGHKCAVILTADDVSAFKDI